MSDIPVHLRELVIDRARSYCEYCGLSQVSQEATFHIDHVIPRIDGGPTAEANLALACVSCSLRKGDRRMGDDPQTGRAVMLFNPRTDGWREHFWWNGVYLEGSAPTGRATIVALAMNRPTILAIRHEEQERSRHPPPHHLDHETNG